jgi:hypothetical protein
MKRTLLALTAVGAVAAAGVSIPNQAQAVTPAWVVPAIVGAGVGGLFVGGAVAASEAPYAAYSPGYNPPGTVYVRPSAAPSRCYMARERIAGGWRRVQVCD